MTKPQGPTAAKAQPPAHSTCGAAHVGVPALLGVSCAVSVLAHIMELLALALRLSSSELHC